MAQISQMRSPFYSERLTTASASIEQLVGTVRIVEEHNWTPDSCCAQEDLDVLMTIASHDSNAIAVSQTMMEQS